MTKAYIILAHKNPTQIERLIESLNDGLSSFFLHLDLKSTLTISDITLKSSVALFPVKRTSSTWGSFGLVQATLNALQLVNQQPITFDRIILLSGQDYPLKSNTFINEFYRNSQYSIFIDNFTLPNFKKWSSNGGLYRVDKYFFGLSSFSRFSARISNFLALQFKAFRRSLDSKIIHHHGSQWWTIDSYALKYILNFVNENPKYIAFHKYTFAPDELFFQTILMNAKDPLISSRIVNDNKMFMKWENEFVAHPEILTNEDFNELKFSPGLFARKFDEQVDMEILDMIDKFRTIE